MKPLFLTLFSAGLLTAQSSQQTITSAGGVDVNGRPIPGSTTSVVQSGNTTTTIDSTQSLNGRSVPAERVTERVLSDNGRGDRVVERMVQRFDPTGNPLPAEKVRVEEHKAADGSGTQNVTVYRGDINGNMSVAEQAKTVIKKSGNTTTADTQVDRPTLNGSLEPVERRNVVTTEADGRTQQVNVTSRRDQNGNFNEFGREIIDRTVQNGQTVENRAQYTSNITGSPRLLNQIITRTEKKPDGSAVSVSDIYSTDLPGRVLGEQGTQPQLREQLTTERVVGPNGTVTDRVVTRKADPSNPKKLHDPQFVSQTTCQGNCVDKK